MPIKGRGLLAASGHGSHTSYRGSDCQSEIAQLRLTRFVHSPGHPPCPAVQKDFEAIVGDKADGLDSPFKLRCV